MNALTMLRANQLEGRAFGSPQESESMAISDVLGRMRSSGGQKSEPAT
jgi:hypothetical protein